MSTTAATRVVGAYAAAPEAPVDSALFAARVLALPGVDGLEISWGSASWPTDNAMLDAVLGGHESRHTHVLTLVGAQVELATTGVGLASPRASTRGPALELVHRARDAVAAWAAAGRRIVAVELHAFPSMPPSRAGAAADALHASLTEVLSWNWAGAAVLVEHCDARSGEAPEPAGRKGLLPLDVELAVMADLASSRTPTGVVVNWGRSALEERDPATPPRHVAAARRSGLLRGVVISGTARVDGRTYGPAWTDAHLPLDTDAPESALSEEHVTATMVAAGGSLLFDGVKVAARPADLSIDARVGMVRRTLATLPTR